MVSYMFTRIKVGNGLEVILYASSRNKDSNSPRNWNRLGEVAEISKTVWHIAGVKQSQETN